MDAVERVAAAIRARFHGGSSGLDELSDAIALDHAQAALSAIHYAELQAVVEAARKTSTLSVLPFEGDTRDNDAADADQKALGLALSALDAKADDAI